MGTVFKRKGKGGLSYTARIRRQGYPAFTRTFTRLTDARAWIEQEETKIRQGLHLDYTEARKRTVSQAIDRYVLEAVPNKNRMVHLRRWRDHVGALFLSALTEIRINDLTAQWKNVGIEGKRLDGSTINRHLNSLSMVLRSAKEWGWIQRNPTLDAKKFPESKGRVRYLSEDERVRLLGSCKKSDYPFLYLIVVLALSTGMRKEELLSLTWNDVDLNSGILILKKTKNKERRRVSVRGLALDLLRKHSKIRQIDSDFLFPGEKRSPARDNIVSIDAHKRHYDIRKPWQRALKVARIDDFVFHDLRHCCASYLAMNGATSLEIAEVLGHKTLDVVKRYAHLSESHTAKVVENMNQKIFG